jgi:hypothetical protein
MIVKEFVQRYRLVNLTEHPIDEAIVEGMVRFVLNHPAPFFMAIDHSSVLSFRVLWGVFA